MGAVLKRDGDTLTVKLGGYDEKDEFFEALEKAKNITPRRYDDERKLWVYPYDINVAQRLVHALEPDMSAEVLAWVRQAGERVAEELRTALPDDAPLAVPSADNFFKYQRAGVDFMAEHPHTILADEMGLGKTIQSIAAVLERRIRAGGAPGDAIQPTGLVIAPNSSLYGWQRTLEVGPVHPKTREPLWADWPHQRATVIDGYNSQKQLKQLNEALAEPGWVLVNWEKLRTDKVGPALQKQKWDAVIADEAHRAKNRNARQTKALHKLRAPIQLALTGTPVMNHPGDLWSLLHWLRPEQYTSYWRFHNEYCEDHPGYRGKRVVTGVRNIDGLRFELADKLVRRTAKAVLPDLPELFPPDFRTIHLGPKQRALYEQAENDLWLGIEQAASLARESDDTEALEELRGAVEEHDLQKIQYLIPNGAARTTRLRQVRTSPALLGGEKISAPIDAVLEIINDADPDRQFVVFSWFKESADLLVERLQGQRPPIVAASYHGDVDAKYRPELVDQFQAGDIRVLAMTIKTGGEAIDLFAADTAIFLERDWVPANNRQAVKRLHRQGQLLPVREIIIECQDTVDDGRIAAANRVKGLISSAILGES